VIQGGARHRGAGGVVKEYGSVVHVYGGNVAFSWSCMMGEG